MGVMYGRDEIRDLYRSCTIRYIKKNVIKKHVGEINYRGMKTPNRKKIHALYLQRPLLHLKSIRRTNI